MTIDQDGREDISSRPLDTLPHHLPYYDTTIKSRENWQERGGMKLKTAGGRRQRVLLFAFCQYEIQVDEFRNAHAHGNPSNEVVKTCERNERQSIITVTASG
jgi:hypothetical protein